jgi:hypothetical protein
MYAQDVYFKNVVLYITIRNAADFLILHARKMKLLIIMPALISFRFALIMLSRACYTYSRRIFTKNHEEMQAYNYMLK